MMMVGPLLARFFWTNLLCDLFLPFDISSVKTRLDFVQSPFPACFVCGFFSLYVYVYVLLSVHGLFSDLYFFFDFLLMGSFFFLLACVS